MTYFGAPPDSFEFKHPFLHAFVCVVVTGLIGGTIIWWLL